MTDHLNHGEAEALSEGVLAGPLREEEDAGLVPFPLLGPDLAQQGLGSYCAHRRFHLK